MLAVKSGMFIDFILLLAFWSYKTTLARQNVPIGQAFVGMRAWLMEREYMFNLVGPDLCSATLFNVYEGKKSLSRKSSSIYLPKPP